MGQVKSNLWWSLFEFLSATYLRMQREKTAKSRIPQSPSRNSISLSQMPLSFITRQSAPSLLGKIPHLASFHTSGLENGQIMTAIPSLPPFQGSSLSTSSVIAKAMRYCYVIKLSRLHGACRLPWRKKNQLGHWFLLLEMEQDVKQ